MAGGPLGGRDQNGATKIDSRRRPARLIAKIEEHHFLLAAVPDLAITSVNWFNTITPSGMFTYLDPPYVGKGGSLYRHGAFDHLWLSLILRERWGWLLSYDDTPKIHELYSWARVEPVGVMSALRHTAIRDVMITRRSRAEELAA
jgi:hypothetical protein